MRISDWSSDVCSSDLIRSAIAAAAVPAAWFGILIAVPAVMIGHGWEAWEVGLLLAPSAVVGLVVPRIAGPFLNKYGGPRALAFAGVNASVAMVVASFGAEHEAAFVLALPVVFPTIRSEEHTSELPQLMRNPYAVFCF